MVNRMIKFSDDFFKEEERNGYQVDSMMKKIWATEMDVLSYLIEVCKKNNITYFADWGTLLGAIRHKGFIPWDDDIDIVLKREDYNRLVKILNSDLPEDYYFSSVYGKNNHMQPFSCLMTARELPLSKDKVDRFYGCPFIAGVDIYVIDYVPRDKELAELQLNLCGMVYDLARQYLEYEKEGTVEGYIKHIEEMCNVQIERGDMVRKNLWRLYDQLCGMFKEDESDKLTWFSRLITRSEPYYLEKSWYESAIEVPFENMSIAVPVGYDELLKIKYGNYMEMKISGGHDTFGKQREYLKKKGLIE